MSDNLPVVPSRGGKTYRDKPLKSRPQSSSKLFDLDVNLKDFISHPELDEEGNVAIDAQLANNHRPQSLQEESLSDQIDVETEEDGGNLKSDADDHPIEEEETDLNSIVISLTSKRRVILI